MVYGKHPNLEAFFIVLRSSSFRNFFFKRKKSDTNEGVSGGSFIVWVVWFICFNSNYLFLNEMNVVFLIVSDFCVQRSLPPSSEHQRNSWRGTKYFLKRLSLSKMTINF